MSSKKMQTLSKKMRAPKSEELSRVEARLRAALLEAIAASGKSDIELSGGLCAPNTISALRRNRSVSMSAARWFALMERCGAASLEAAVSRGHQCVDGEWSEPFKQFIADPAYGALLDIGAWERDLMLAAQRHHPRWFSSARDVAIWLGVARRPPSDDRGA